MSVYNISKNIVHVIVCLKIFFTFTNSAEPDEILIIRHFIWVFTVGEKVPRIHMG